MSSYLKYISYFSLSVADSIINLAASLLKVYPGFDMSGAYLASRELKRALKWDLNHQKIRQLKAKSAFDQMENVKRDSGV